MSTAPRYDIVALGEVMLRLDPGEGRIRNARGFRVWEGGGEYNVARGLRRCFGLRAAVVTALVDNEIGRLVEDCMLQGGVDTSHVIWRPFDGTGRALRNGLNFTERGFGVRGAVGVSDRGHTAAAALRAGDVDWHRIFSVEGARWFHTGGVFAALSETTPGVIAEAIEVARDAGTTVSYDLNYRPSLWKALGGFDAARAVNRELAGAVDVLIGNEEDFTACLGLEVAGVDEHLTALDPSAFEAMIEQATSAVPEPEGRRDDVARGALGDAQRLGRRRVVGRDRLRPRVAAARSRDSRPRRRRRQLRRRPGVRIARRACSSPDAVEWGAAHGALAMTTPGDTSTATLDEVRALVAGAGARVRR